MPTLAERYERLSLPFPAEVVELKPGATNQDKTRALALAYVDARHYQQRLDECAGVEGWNVEYRQISDRAILCRLTILGIVREDVGEAEGGDPNQATSAAMQAFKRACAAFGLGRYLYTDLPQLWVACEQKGKNVYITDQRGAVQQMYDSAGIDLSKRGKIVHRIRVLLSGKTEDDLMAIGRHIANLGTA